MPALPKKSASVLSGVKLGVSDRRKGPLWKGPEVDGITFSLLSRFLTCRERFRLYVIEGWKPVEQFNHKIEYGNMWHACEEAAAAERSWSEGNLKGIDTTAWEDALKNYAQKLCQRYPIKQEDISHWYEVCKVQFPVYVKYWSEHPDIKTRTPLLQEQVFDVPYELPSGRTVRLRGKWDSVDLVGEGKNGGVWLMENKSKGDIDEEKMKRQLKFDLQSMLYLIALGTPVKKTDAAAGRNVKGWTYGSEIKGVRYNVIRRPLSGGEGTIVQKKGSKNVPPESREAYYERVRGVIDGTGLNSKGEPYPGPPHFFMRWNVEITPRDIQKFKERCFNELLEAVCNWYDYVARKPVSVNELVKYSQYGQSWQHPFGVRNFIDEGGATDLDEYLFSGSTVGLRKVEELFPELKT